MNSRKERAGRAVDLAATLLRAAHAQETPEEKSQARRLARMMEDPRGKELTIALVDQSQKGQTSRIATSTLSRESPDSLLARPLLHAPGDLDRNACR